MHGQSDGNVLTGLRQTIQDTTEDSPWHLARLVVSWNCLTVVEFLCSASASLLWVRPERSAYLCRWHLTVRFLVRSRVVPGRLGSSWFFSQVISGDSEVVPFLVDGATVTGHRTCECWTIAQNFEEMQVDPR